jgi:Tfp pilus assembly protein PilV
VHPRTQTASPNGLPPRVRLKLAAPSADALGVDPCHDPRPRRLSALRARARERAASESGVTLIEILMSAVLLAIIVIGTLTAFDAAGRITTDQQVRSEANDLAQQDQDHLRSLQVSQLPLLQTHQVTVNGTVFTVQEQADYTSDSTGTSTCTSSGSADYVKTTSTITWPAIGTRPPIVLESIITPPVGGALVVQVVNAQGAGVSGMSVSAVGPSTLSGTTSAAGCAIFGAVPAGNYNVSVSQAGYVDKDGNTSPPASQQATTVVNGATDRMSFQYDHAGQINVSFDTKYTGLSQPVASTADTVVIYNNNMTYPSYRWAGTSGTYGSTVTASNVFSFTSAYTVYAGSCSADAPSANGQSSDPSVVVPAGGTASVVLHLPALLLKVYTGTSSLPGPLANTPHVVLYDLGCGGSPPTAGGSPPISNTIPTNTTGGLVDPGVPYGTYKVCADNGIKSISQASLPINDPVKGTTLTLYLGSGSSGTCP